MPEETGSQLHRRSVPVRYVDTHCHLDDDSFETDLDDVLAKSRAAGVDRWIVVGFAPARWASSLAIADRFDGASVMLGVHPGHSTEWSPSIRADLEALVDARKPVAIGEIGLDFFRGETNLAQQRNAFVDQLGIAVERGLPAVIHMRDAIDRILDVLATTSPLPSLIFHSYDGPARMTDWILDNGASIGVGGLATRGKSSDLRREIARVPPDQIVLETDSPYLVPRGFRHSRNTPESIPAIAEALATMTGTAVDRVASETTAAAERLFPGIAAHAKAGGQP